MMAFRIVPFFPWILSRDRFRRNVEKFPTCQEPLKDSVHCPDSEVKSRRDKFEGNFEISLSVQVLSFLPQLLALILEVKVI